MLSLPKHSVIMLMPGFLKQRIYCVILMHVGFCIPGVTCHCPPFFQGAYMQPGARENIAYLTHTERRKDFQYEAMQERREAENMAQRGIGVAASSVPMNFKDLIETKAEEHNIVFMPVIGKRHEGKQLYTFGRIVIYIDRGVVFVQGEKTWVPTSLQSLIDMAK